jgi:hypothetical protein
MSLGNFDVTDRTLSFCVRRPVLIAGRAQFEVDRRRKLSLHCLRMAVTRIMIVGWRFMEGKERGVALYR